MSKIMKCISVLLTFLFLMISVISCNSKLMRKVTILYRADGGELRSLTFSVPDGSFLEGNPSNWGDGSWKTGNTGDFGYQLIINNNEIKNYFFRKENEQFQFYYTHSERIFSTSSPVTTDLNLQPVYKETASNADINLIYYISNVTYDQQGMPSYSLKECKYSENFPADNNGKYTFTIQNFVNNVRNASKVGPDNVQVLDVEVGYGYVDYSDNGKRYYLDPSDYVLVDKDGNIYENQVSVPGDTDLYFRYTEAGYAPMEDYIAVADSKPIYFDMVYIPGTEGNKYPWPNSQSDMLGTLARQASAAKESTFTDTKDFNHPVKDLKVMEIPVLTSFAKAVKEGPFEDVFNTKFKFYPLEAASDDEIAVEFKSTNLTFVDNVPWGRIGIDVAMLMANMVTYLYNEANKTAAGFEPLSYVYKISGNLPLTDITAENYDASNVIIDHEASGFRLMSSHEWEYCAKVITDERQLPVFTSDQTDEAARFHKKGDTTGYRFYFQNSNDGKYGIKNNSTNNIYYSGSGAGLATAVNTSLSGEYAYKINSINANHFGEDYFTYVLKYQPANFRLGYMALGRDVSTNGMEKEDTVVKTVPASATYSIFNTRNGAGLYHMSGREFTLTDSKFDRSYLDQDGIVKIPYATRGSGFNYGISDPQHMIGNIVYPTSTTNRWSSCVLRLCRNAY